jgi:hypothetical protein
MENECDLILLREKKIEESQLLREDEENYNEKIESLAIDLENVIEIYIKEHNLKIAEYLNNNAIFDYLLSLKI